VIKVCVPISGCNIGDILAEDVNNEKGITLAAKNTLINLYIKNRLIDLEIEYVWLFKLEEPLSSVNNIAKYDGLMKSYKDTILLEKQLLNELTIGRKLDYQKVDEIAEVVYKNVDDSNHIAKCLMEIRTMDEYTYTHCVNVSFYSMLIAKWLKLSPQIIKDVIRAGLLHDIGKVKISNEILNKKGKLSSQEFEVIKKHSLYGYELIKDIPELSEGVKQAVLSHHERMDGSGYPQGLTGSTIGLYAKIVAVADVYDAMTQNRIYKNKVSPFEAFEMFSTIGLSAFDTDVLSIFLKHLSASYIGTNVLLSNGEKGEIVYIPPQEIISPIVSVGENYIDLSKETSLKVSMVL
jgi:putative nucleotidyltransferase with HDIG domain